MFLVFRKHQNQQQVLIRHLKDMVNIATEKNIELMLENAEMKRIEEVSSKALKEATEKIAKLKKLIIDLSEPSKFYDDCMKNASTFPRNIGIDKGFLNYLSELDKSEKEMEENFIVAIQKMEELLEREKEKKRKEDEEDDNEDKNCKVYHFVMKSEK